MNIRQKTAIKTFLFLLIGLIIFSGIENIFTKKLIFGGEVFGQGKSEIDLMKDTDFDVLFLGSSHVYCGVSPLELYEKYGIISYNRGSSVQPLAGSYYLLKRAYQTHDIQTVVLDVSTMFGDSENSCWRIILDLLPIGKDKYELTKEYIKYEWSDGFAAALFPIIAYHSSWSVLEKGNFDFSAMYDYALGQSIKNGIESSMLTQWDEINRDANIFSNYKGHTTEILRTERKEWDSNHPIWKPVISESSLSYLLKIKEFCDRHEIKLLLMKIPVMCSPRYYYAAWTKEKSEMISQIAVENHIPFLDILMTDKTLLDFNTDTFDGGMHLNSYGAIKVSDFLGEYLLENGFVSSKRKSNLQYDENLEKYRKVRAVMEQQRICDFRTYINCLKDHLENHIVVIAASVDYMSGMAEEDLRIFDELGLSLIANGKIRNSYAAILSDGEIIYESLSDYEISHQDSVEGVQIELSSRNWYNVDPGASVKMNGIEYSQSQRGLNIIVYDYESGCVIDNVAFDTFDPTKPAIRDESWKYSLLKTYEAEICYER